MLGCAEVMIQTTSCNGARDPLFSLTEAVLLRTTRTQKGSKGKSNIFASGVHFAHSSYKVTAPVNVIDGSDYRFLFAAYHSQASDVT